MNQHSIPVASHSPMASVSGGIHIKVEACGSSTGNDVQVWDDGFHVAIRQICIYFSENAVNCIQVAYSDPLKGTVSSAKHGDSRFSDFFAEITISPDDLIVSVSGCYYTAKADSNTNQPKQRLTSLKFTTASGITYGPYGIDASVRKKSFSFKAASRVRGFHGSTNGCSLCAIGIYVQSQASTVS